MHHKSRFLKEFCSVVVSNVFRTSRFQEDASGTTEGEEWEAVVGEFQTPRPAPVREIHLSLLHILGV